MGFLKEFCLLLVIGCALAKEAYFPSPCSVKDVECIDKANKQYLENLSSEVPKYGLKPFDPVVISEFEVKIIDEGKLNFKNLKITGFKNENITGFEVNRETKTVKIDSTENVNIDGDFEVEFTTLSKSFPGKYLAKAGAAVTASYNYELKTDDKGIEHIHFGPETLTCKTTESNVTPDPQLLAAINAEPEAKKLQEKYQEQREEFYKQVACKIIEKGLENVAHNFRITADYMPKTAFFTDF